jgi:hypothetical protein
MKTKSFLILFLLISSCKSDLKFERTIRTFELINNIGVIRLNLTNEFDTLHSWTRSSDYECGTEQYYRLQSSKYPMLEEEYFSNFPDSMYGVTISHRFFPACIKKHTTFQPDLIIEKIKENRAHLVGIHNASFKLLKQEEINNFKFVIYATIDTTHQNIIEQQLSAITYINKYPIKIEFLKTSTNLSDTSFIWDSYNMLKTIKIKKH